MKAMLRRWQMCAFVLLLSSLTGCIDYSVGTAVVQKTEVSQAVAVSFSSVVTKGNRSYIPLNLSGNAATNHEIILDILKKFEDEKNLEITDWKFSDQQPAYTTPAFTQGLWVDHKPR